MREPGVGESVACIACGYDLRALAAGASCPECGAAVGETLRVQRRCLRLLPWLVAITFVAGLLMVVGACSGLSVFTFNWPEIGMNLLVGLTSLALALVLLAGVLLLVRQGWAPRVRVLLMLAFAATTSVGAGVACGHIFGWSRNYDRLALGLHLLTCGAPMASLLMLEVQRTAAIANPRFGGWKMLVCHAALTLGCGSVALGVLVMAQDAIRSRLWHFGSILGDYADLLPWMLNVGFGLVAVASLIELMWLARVFVRVRREPLGTTLAPAALTPAAASPAPRAASR